MAKYKISRALIGALIVLVSTAALAVPAWAQTTVRQLSLQQAIELALANNEQIGIADASVDQAKGAIWEAKSGALPHLTGYAEYKRNLTKPTTEVDYFSALTPLMLANGLPPIGPAEQELAYDNEWLFNLHLEQALYTCGRLGNAIRLARAYEDLAHKGRVRVGKDVVNQTEQAYLLVLLAQQSVEINRQALEQTISRRDDIKAKRDRGLVSDYELMAAQTEVAKLRPEVLNAERNYNTAMLALKLQMGLALNERIALTDELAQLPLELSLQESVDEALAFRDEIGMLRSQIDAKRYESRIYRAGFLPVLSAFGDVSYASQLNDDFWPKEEADEFKDFVSVGVGLAWPIFDGMESWAQMRQAKAQVRSSELSLSQASRGIELEVTSLYQELQNIDQEIQARKQTVALAQKTYELAEIRFNSGLSTQLEVSDALLNLTATRVSLAEAIFRHALTRTNLLRAMGR
ncbi:MAG: TolC family protein [Candidatus Alcyoniella australis]|nr:TolC family protein [Candidatus Alcyoniella australis]